MANEIPSGLTEGRVVHYVMSDGSHRAAMVVRVFAPGSQYANLSVMTDGGNDKEFSGWTQENQVMQVWRPSVKYSETKEPDTWHYPERA